MSVPIVKPFSAENFLSPTKIGPKMAVFRWFYYFFVYFQNPKRHILAWDRVFWRILREDQFCALGCSLFEEPKNEHLGVIFHVYGEKKPLVGSAQNFALGRYPEHSHRCKFGGRSVEPFLRSEGSNFRLFHRLLQSSLQHFRTTVRVCDARLIGSLPAKSSPVNFMPTTMLKSNVYIMSPLITRLANMSFSAAGVFFLTQKEGWWTLCSWLDLI